MVEYNPYVYLWGLGNDVYPFEELDELKGVSSVIGSFLINSNAAEPDKLNPEWYNAIPYIKKYHGKFWISIGGANGPHFWESWDINKFVEVMKTDVLDIEGL